MDDDDDDGDDNNDNDGNDDDDESDDEDDSDDITFTKWFPSSIKFPSLVPVFYLLPHKTHCREQKIARCLTKKTTKTAMESQGQLLLSRGLSRGISDLTK